MWSEVTGINAAQDVPSRTDGSGTTGEEFSDATWNIWSGRNGGLESACKSLDSTGVNIALLQETKLTNGIYTWQSHN